MATELWGRIQGRLGSADRALIQDKLDNGAAGLENALDLLDDGGPESMPLRYTVAKAIGDCFREISAPLGSHDAFVRTLSRRFDYRLHLFSLNYDPLIERAAENAGVRVRDGFIGYEHALFYPGIFSECIGQPMRKRGSRVCGQLRGTINLYKLHGSLGWYQGSGAGIRRCAFGAQLPDGTQPLMVPPQHRKASDTSSPPYSVLWGEFRGVLSHGPDLLNRLVSIGYGMQDEHVNAVLEGALARSNFNLMIMTKELTNDAFARWSVYQRVIIVTENRSSVYGKSYPGSPDFWSLERISREII